MRFNVSLELKGSLPDFKNQMQEVIRIAALTTRNEWVKIARKNLRSSAAKYIEGIGEPIIRRNRAEISLDPGFPSMIENGAPAFDMKPGLLKSRKAHRSRDGGKYLHVPLALKTPGGGNRGPSPPVMPAPIYTSATKMHFGQSMRKMPLKYENLGMMTRLSPNLAKWQHYTWKTSPYVGVTKVRKYPDRPKGTPAGRLAGYMTFRTVSTKSDPSSWIHPGFRAKNLMERTQVELDQKFPEIMNVIMGA